jgi:hypothetical protein
MSSEKATCLERSRRKAIFPKFSNQEGVATEGTLFFLLGSPSMHRWEAVLSLSSPHNNNAYLEEDRLFSWALSISGFPVVTALSRKEDNRSVAQAVAK